jgi:uncharacterized protein YbbC (DUF1343 family)
MKDLQVGLEVIEKYPIKTKGWGRCGLLSNQASVDRNLQPAWRILKELLGSQLVSLFGPQHGFFGTCQDNMIETGHHIHGPTRLPIHSLYSEVREPTGQMLEGLDTLIIDLQIVGCRIYTWKSTIAGCLRAAKSHGKQVVVLDRPNPIGGTILEGNALEMDAASFVGQFPIPMRHGLTGGEAALFFNQSIGANLQVIALENWDPSLVWDAFGRHWVPTSPNLPTIAPVHVYPGTVIFEGTNLSEGRGTALPFQLIGAPYISDSETFVERVRSLLKNKVPGVHLRPTSFQPTFHKWNGQECNGLQIHVIDPVKVRSFPLALAILQAAMEFGGNSFQWKQPPYEYDLETLPIKLIIGSLNTLSKFGENFSVADKFWTKDTQSYIEKIEPILLYPRRVMIGD